MADHSSAEDFDISETQMAGSGLLLAKEMGALQEAVNAIREYPAGETLAIAGEELEFLHVIVEGWACRVRKGSGNHRQILALYLPGDVCNIDALLSGRTGSDIETLTKTVVATLPRQRFFMLGWQEPAIASSFAWIAIRDNRFLAQWALRLGSFNACTGLANLFCELTMRLDACKIGNVASFMLPLTQEDLAQMLGLTNVHVSRTMQDLRSDGLIEKKPGKTIYIPDFKKLCEVGEFDESFFVPGTGMPAAEATA